MKRLLSILLATLILLPGLSGAHAEDGLTLRSEIPVALKGPVYWLGEAEALPNGNLVFHYIVDKAADPVFDLYELRLALIAPDGTVIRDEHWGHYDKNSLFANDDAWQFVIGEGTFTREFYRDPSWSTQSWSQWTWDGTLLNGSKTIESLKDGDKRIVINLYPFRVEEYCFGDEDSVPDVINHGKLIHVPDGTEGELLFGQYFLADGALYVINGPEQDKLTLRQFDTQCREILTLPLDLKENEFVEDILPGAEGPVLILLQQIKTDEPRIWRESRRACVLKDGALSPLTWRQERAVDRDAWIYQEPLLITDGGVVCHTYRWAGVQNADSKLALIDHDGIETPLNDPEMNIQFVSANGSIITALGLDAAEHQIVLKEYSFD